MLPVIARKTDIFEDDLSYLKDNMDINGNSKGLQPQFDIQGQQDYYYDGHPVSCCEDGLDIYCPNKHMGCEWTGSLTDVVEHTNYQATSKLICI